jgi:hypothetical protein
MKAIHFIIEHWDVILTGLGVICGLIQGIKHRETGVIKSFLFKFVTDAEREFGQNTGALKFATVLAWVYDKLPSSVKLLFSEKELTKLIEDALAHAKTKWETNEALKEYIESPKSS